MFPRKSSPGPLNVEIKPIKTKRTLLDGVFPEVADMLKDKSIDTEVFAWLRKLKPMPQIEAVELMAAMNNFTARYAHVLLATTRQENLAQSGRPKNIRGLTPEQVARMEREMDGLQRESKQSRRPMEIPCSIWWSPSGYVSSLIGNSRMSRYLERHHPEMLTEFKSIIAATTLEQAVSGGPRQP